MKMNSIIRGDFAARRSAILALLLAAALSAGGCAWWDKNVTKKVRGVTNRKITVSTDPPGADVYVGDVYQGKSPLTLKYKVGVRDFIDGFVVVVNKKGYLPVRREVSIKKDNVFLRLIRKRRRK
jgi:hypothetical protein